MSRALAAVVAAALLLTVFGRAARADEVEACASAATEAQRLRRDGKLTGARARILACARAECPFPVRSLCADLARDVEASLPTVIVGARDPHGRDIAAARVLLDGIPLAGALEGKAIPVDPGPHTLRVEREGSAPAEQGVVIREGEKNRLLLVVLDEGTPPTDRPSPSPSPAVAQPPPESTSAPASASTSASGRAPVAAYVLGGLGLASLATFAVLAVDGQRRYDACSSTPHCSGNAVDALLTERVAAWVTLGAGVALLGVSAWLFLAHPAPSAHYALVLDPTPGGIVAGIHGAL
jgi:hypothetical protein